MKPRFSPFASMSVLVQVALLAVFAVVASQAVVFAVVLTAPPPRPEGFSIAAAADALSGKPAETSDGRALKRHLSDAPPQRNVDTGPVERGIGAGLAAFAGVLAAPIYQVSPLMGSNIIIVVFAVVVVGGMGSIMGAIVTGFSLGLIEGLTKVFYPEAAATVIFIIMVLVLLVKPAGLFGRTT